MVPGLHFAGKCNTHSVERQGLSQSQLQRTGLPCLSAFVELLSNSATNILLQMGTNGTFLLIIELDNSYTLVNLTTLSLEPLPIYLYLLYLGKFVSHSPMLISKALMHTPLLQANRLISNHLSYNNVPMDVL